MKESKKVILISIITVLLALFLIIGLSYAFLIANVIGDPNDVTGKFIEAGVEYSDTSSIQVDNLMPGWTYTKTVTVTNNNDGLLTYDLNFNELINTFETGYLVYSVTSNDGGCNIEETPVPYVITEPSTRLICTKEINANSVHTYEIKFEYKKYDESGEELNHGPDMGKKFSGYIEVGNPERVLAKRIILDNAPMSDKDLDFNYSSNGITGCEYDGSSSFIGCTTDTTKITKGLYYTSDPADTENGERVYYYRGEVENNYVIFGGYCWRIVRTNEVGGVRLRYGGVPNENGSCPETGTKVNIGSSTFNTATNNAKYVGYTYDNGSGVQVDSNIKQFIESWYEENMWKNGNNTQVTNLIEDAIYCNDRSEPKDVNYFGPMERLASSRTQSMNPTYVCEREEDRYTESGANGNGLLKYPVGLLTSDEMMFAGGRHGANNTTYYLYTGEVYRTMSPVQFKNSTSYVAIINTSGPITATTVSSSLAVVPVISLVEEAKVSSGNGDFDNPYVIQY